MPDFATGYYVVLGVHWTRGKICSDFSRTAKRQRLNTSRNPALWSQNHCGASEKP